MDTAHSSFPRIYLLSTVLLLSFLNNVTGKHNVWSNGVADVLKETVAHQVEKASTLLQQFERYMMEFGKSYKSPAERMLRFDIFKENLQVIERIMATRRGNAVYGLGPFTDLTSKEFMSLYVSGFRPGLRPRVVTRRSPTNTPSEEGGGGTKKSIVKPSGINLPKLLPPGRPAGDTFGAPEETKTPLRLADSPRTGLETPGKRPRLTPKLPGDLKGANEKPGQPPPSPITKGLESPARGGAKGPVFPDSPPPIRLDWTERLRMYPFVESQNLGDKVCGACWAFAVGGALDVAVARQKGKVQAIFSKQQLIDCVTESNGCTYGNLHSPLDYLVEKGLTLSKNYPYRADNGECNTTLITGTLTRIASWEHLDPKDIEKALVTSPVVTAVHFPPALQHYNREVADPVDCSNNETMLNHAAVIVGYEPDHWIIRNSHGLQYGWKGHLRLKKNTCGVGIYSFAIKLLPPAASSQTGK